jgi:hypothetical protein
MASVTLHFDLEDVNRQQGETDSIAHRLAVSVVGSPSGAGAARLAMAFQST